MPGKAAAIRDISQVRSMAFSQPWGNEVIPQQVLFCLLSLREEWTPWEQGSFQTVLGSGDAAGSWRGQSPAGMAACAGAWAAARGCGTSRASLGSGFPLAWSPKEGTSPCLLEGARVFSSSCLPSAMGPKMCLSHLGLSLGRAPW